jgi:hypothetical protein
MDIYAQQTPSMQSHKFMRHLRLGPCLQMLYSARAPDETPIKGFMARLRDCTLGRLWKTPQRHL